MAMLPDYLTDLNAIHDVENIIINWEEWELLGYGIVNPIKKLKHY